VTTTAHGGELTHPTRFGHLDGPGRWPFGWGDCPHFRVAAFNADQFDDLAHLTAAVITTSIFHSGRVSAA
jgi:hypothetical protein